MLCEWGAILDELKFHLLRAQQIMKNNEDKHRRDVSFVLGDWVFLKLQPYKQKCWLRNSMRSRRLDIMDLTRL